MGSFLGLQRCFPQPPCLCPTAPLKAVTPSALEKGGASRMAALGDCVFTLPALSPYLSALALGHHFAELVFIF